MKYEAGGPEDRAARKRALTKLQRIAYIILAVFLLFLIISPQFYKEPLVATVNFSKINTSNNNYYLSFNIKNETFGILFNTSYTLMIYDGNDTLLYSKSVPVTEIMLPKQMEVFTHSVTAAENTSIRYSLKTECFKLFPGQAS